MTISFSFVTDCAEMSGGESIVTQASVKQDMEVFVSQRESKSESQGQKRVSK